MKQKLLVIGGAGNIGKAIIYRLLQEKHAYINLTSLDRYTNLEEECPYTQIPLRSVHDKKDGVADLIAEHHYVINAGPFHISFDIAKAAIRGGTHYFDLTEDVHQARLIRDLVNDDTQTVVMPQCGLAPGYISVLANYMAKEFDIVNDIRMRVGALPLYPTNKLKYNTTWSMEGMINECVQDCISIKNNDLVMVPALGDYETFAIDGAEYEAFNTSGGVGTMCETWGVINNLNYKSIRYPGHHHLMSFLLEDLNFKSNNGKQLSEVLNVIPATTNDVVIIFVSVTGIKNGKDIEKTVVKKIYGDEKFSGIQKATAESVYGMYALHRRGQSMAITKPFPKMTGFVKQEEVSLFSFLDVLDSRNGWRCYND